MDHTMDHKQAASAIAAWARAGQGNPLPAWDDLPAIPLYMDQVILYLTESLRLFQPEGEPSLLTSSMINNYVKHGLLPHPEKKKYSREHLGALMAICALKQVLSMQDVDTLFGQGPLDRETYALFREAHQRAVQETCQALEKTCREKEDLKQAALLLAVEANAKRAAAERILCELGKQEKPAGKEKRD